MKLNCYHYYYGNSSEMPILPPLQIHHLCLTEELDEST